MVSKGPEASKVTLISFADMAQSDAESRIRLMNLEVGEIEHVSSETVPEGKVVEQWPEAGTAVSYTHLTDLADRIYTTEELDAMLEEQGK